MRAIRGVRASAPLRRGPASMALTLCVGVALLLAAPASANTPITGYSSQPSNSQAGGHPDVEIYFTVANRVLQHTQSACNCEDVKDATVHLPAGFIGNPHATPQCYDRRVLRRRMPDRLPGGNRQRRPRRTAFPSTRPSTI